MAEFFHKPSSAWPWVRFSDGTELSNGSRIFARALRDFAVERGGLYKPRTVKAGAKVLVVMAGPSLVLGKIGTGNTRWHEMARDVREGVDFELIGGKALVEFDESAWRAALEAHAVRL